MTIKEFVKKSKKLLGVGAIALGGYILGTRVSGCAHMPVEGFYYCPPPRPPMHGRLFERGYGGYPRGPSFSDRGYYPGPMERCYPGSNYERRDR